MSWVKLDDRFFLNPKILRAGLHGRALYLSGVCYCAGALTDGFIPREAVGKIAALADVDGREEAADRLVTLGLWENVEGGYRIHDYLDYNPSSDQIRRERDAARERMSRVRSPELRANFEGSSASPYPARTRPVPVPDPLPDPDPPATASDSSDEPHPADAAAAAFGQVLPNESPEFWDEIAKAGTGLDLDAEAVKIADWRADHPKVRPTRKFLRDWVRRAAADDADRLSRPLTRAPATNGTEPPNQQAPPGWVPPPAPSGWDPERWAAWVELEREAMKGDVVPQREAVGAK